MTREYTVKRVLTAYLKHNKPLLMAIGQDYKPRILTTVEDKRYIVCFTTYKDVSNEGVICSCLAAPSRDILKLAAEYDVDGIVFNPWSKRLAVAKQEVRDGYYSYQNSLYAGNSWWNDPICVDDYDALMWDRGEPYDEDWIAEMLAPKPVIRNVAWWAKPQKNPYKETPLAYRIWLAFYGLFYLQNIFATGLNTIYMKEIDEGGLITCGILTVGLALIFKFNYKVGDWWEKKLQEKKEREALAQWEAEAPQREAEARAKEEAEALRLAVEQRVLEHKQAALAYLMADMNEEEEMTYKTVIFDLDGTLLDTLTDLAISINHALKVNGYPEHTLDEVRQYVGNGAAMLVKRAVPPELKENEAVLQAVHKAFDEYYSVHYNDNTKPYPGILELLAKLRAQGCQTAIVSNKPDYGVQSLAKEFFEGLLDAACGEKQGIRRKPAPDELEAIMSILKADKAATIYVGDSDVDVETAKNTGVPCIAVTWGFRSREFLAEHGATIYADKAEDILELVK